MKQTKNVLTRDIIKKELTYQAKASVNFSTVLLLTTGIVIGVPFILLGIAALSDSVVGGTVCILLGAGFLLSLISLCLDGIRMKRLINDGRFYIIKDTVSRLSRGEPRGRYGTVDVIYFKKYGRYVPKQTVFDLSSVGDEFYIVTVPSSGHAIFPSKKSDICFAYHTMMYECNDVDDVTM